jgi:hypothetical protein
MTISSSNYPRFEKNLNDGSNYGENGSPEIVNVKVYHNSQYKSYIELPDPNKKDSDVNYCQNTIDAGYDTADILADSNINDILYEDILPSDNNFTDNSPIMDVVDASLPDALISDILNNDGESSAEGVKSEESSSGCSCSIQ